MNNKYTTGIKKNILTRSFIYRLMVCFIIMFFVYGCAGKNLTLIKAAGSGDLNTVKKLQTEGQNINEADSNGATPLMYAIWSKKVDTAKYFIEAGADLKAKDNSGYDALIYAIDFKQLEIASLLIEKGADIESKDTYGNTPLMHSISSLTNIGFIRMLIKKGVDVNMRNTWGETALESALDSYRRMDIVTALANAGAKLTEPEKGNARLFFITEGAFWRDAVQISVGKQSKDMYENEMRFIDVNPGACKIILKISKVFANPELSNNVEAGKTYYFKITPGDYHKTSRVLLLVAGPLAWTATNVASGGVFTIIPIQESEAKEKIKTLLVH